MYCVNFLSLMSFLQNLCRVARMVLLSLLMYRVWEPISNGITLIWYGPVVVSKCWYFSYFNLWAVSSLNSPGTVSSNSLTVLLMLFMMTKSGFRFLTQIFHLLMSIYLTHHSTLCISLCQDSWGWSEAHCCGAMCTSPKPPGNNLGYGW